MFDNELFREKLEWNSKMDAAYSDYEEEEEEEEWPEDMSVGEWLALHQTR